MLSEGSLRRFSIAVAGFVDANIGLDVGTCICSAGMCAPDCEKCLVPVGCTWLYEAGGGLRRKLRAAEE